MRTHSDIIGTSETIRRAQEITGAPIHTVRSWGQRNSIPAQHWQALSDAGMTTLDELAHAAAMRKPEAA